MTMRKIFLMAFLLSLPLLADECPYGCNSDMDPATKEAGQAIMSALKKMSFEHLEGDDWALCWDAHENIIEPDFDSEDDEDSDEDWIYYYTFESDKFVNDRSVDNGFELDNFLSAKKILLQMHVDLDFVSETQIRDGEKALRASTTKDQKKLAGNMCAEFAQERQKRSEILNDVENQINQIYEDVFSWCIENHNWKGSIYSRGLLFFDKGEFEDAFADVSYFISQVKQRDQAEFLNDVVFFQQGKSASEIGLYHEAVVALSKAIEKNPQFKDAYFERAVAYFEMGKFDQAFNDYLVSNLKPNLSFENAEDLLLFSSAITNGIQQGAAVAAVEFIPSLFSSVYGICEALWVFSQDPVQVSRDFADATLKCLNYVKESSTQEILAVIVPELKELIISWDSLDPAKRGEKAGHIIGKYGVEIFASIGIGKAVKAFQDLKRANQLLIFETVATSKNNQARITAEALRHAEVRKQVLHSVNLKIQPDKQGKHVPGSWNYNPNNAKSILEHPDPQVLVNKFAGTGIKVNNVQPGLTGYQEKVNFGEFIGYVVDRKTGTQTPTTWGKIHYAKDGVHIVPTMPKK